MLVNSLTTYDIVTWFYGDFNFFMISDRACYSMREPERALHHLFSDIHVLGLKIHPCQDIC